MLAFGQVSRYDANVVREIYRKSNEATRCSDREEFEKQITLLEGELTRLPALNGILATVVGLVFAALAVALDQGRGAIEFLMLNAFICVGMAAGIVIRMTMHRPRVLRTDYMHPFQRVRIRSDEEEHYLSLFDKEWRLMAVVQFLKRMNVLAGMLATFGLASFLLAIFIHAVSFL